MVIIPLFLILGIAVGFSEEQYQPPATKLQIPLFCQFGTGQADSSLAAINPPDGLAFTEDGLLLVTDTLNHRVQIFDPYSGKYVGSIGNANIFTGDVVDILVLPNNRLLISDEKANQVYQFKQTKVYPVIFQFIPPPLFSNQGYKKLCGMTCDSKGRVYIVDGITGQVHRYLPNFKLDSKWNFQSMRPDNKPILNKSEGIAIDEFTKTLFLCSDWDGMIQAFNLETGKWLGKSIGRGVDVLTGKPFGQSVFSMSVEGIAIIDNYLLAVDEGEISASKNFPGHLLIFDLRSTVLYETDRESCQKRMSKGIVDALVGWFGNYVSPDTVAVFPGNAKHPEPLVAIANQGSYEVLVYKWRDIKNEITKTQKKEKHFD